MLIGQRTLDAVVFLGDIRGKGAGLAPVYGGTGFFVSVADERPPFYRWPYLVTARHVAQGLRKSSAYMRINLKSGGAREIRLTGEWTYHPDAAVDLAVMAFNPVPDPDTYQLSTVDAESFASDAVIKQLGIGPGDEVCVVGLFVRMVGSQQNLPIVRMGNIAAMPADPIPTKRGDMAGYLIEARSIGGISGSPVLVRETVWIAVDPANPLLAARREPRPETRWARVGGQSRLLGLMHGHWDIPPRDKNKFVIPDEDEDGVNMGIAIVVPASRIHDVLNLPELAHGRREELRVFKERMASRED